MSAARRTRSSVAVAIQPGNRCGIYCRHSSHEPELIVITKIGRRNDLFGVKSCVDVGLIGMMGAAC